MISGFVHIPSYLDIKQQEEIFREVYTLIQSAPFFIPRMPRTGKKFSVQMSNFGNLGWVSDQAGGYRYQEFHPETAQEWPKIPDIFIDIWKEFVGAAVLPEACLVNGYRIDSKMGLHKDQDEQNLSVPVVSVSLGNNALFRIGGLRRKDPTSSVKVKSGDVIILEGDARLAYHGIDRVYSTGEHNIMQEYFPQFSRLNFTLRRVH